MKERSNRAGVTRGLVMLAAVSNLVLAQQAFPGESPTAPSEQTQALSGAHDAQPQVSTPAVSGDASNMMIHVDPKTGAIRKEPAPGTVPLQLTPQLQNALSTSHQGLVEAPSPVAGGGIKVDLQGRFQNPLFATIDADGRVKMQHLDDTPESAGSK